MAPPREAERVLGIIGKGLGRQLNPGSRLRLGERIIGAKARTGWSDGVIAACCIEKVRHVRGVRDPAAWLAEDLDRNVLGGNMEPGRLMVLADKLERLDAMAAELEPLLEAAQGALQADWESRADGRRRRTTTCPPSLQEVLDPVVVAEQLAVEAQILSKDGGESFGDAWPSMTPAQVEQTIEIVERAVASLLRHPDWDESWHLAALDNWHLPSLAVER